MQKRVEELERKLSPVWLLLQLDLFSSRTLQHVGELEIVAGEGSEV